jgi:anionic cell wall polymer biosynthesis LytR-Cps2A-Psr (LCP) family protein|tara:strand:- start:402 stop:617 length:216 start_codon:yes stop_codon:yes gene_type:complete
MEIATIGWIWVGIVIGTVFGIVVSGILSSGKHSELEEENLHLKFVRDSLKEEIFRLDNQVKPKPRSKRRRK